MLNKKKRGGAISCLGARQVFSLKDLEIESSNLSCATILTIKITKKDKMSRLPFKQLNSVIRDVLNRNLVQSGRIQYLPRLVSFKGDRYFNFYVPPKTISQGFVIVVDLKNKDNSIAEFGDYEGRYGERKVDIGPGRRQNLEKDKVIVRGYIEKGAHEPIGRLIEVEIIFHPTQVPKVGNEIPLSSREREILLCFGAIKDGTARREALARLGVSSLEIETLLGKKVLKMTGNGPIMTSLGESNRLPSGNNLEQW